MDSITIAMASAISIDLGILLATFLYKPYLLGYLESCTSCMHRSRLSMMHDSLVAAAIRDKHSLHSIVQAREIETRQ